VIVIIVKKEDIIYVPIGSAVGSYKNKDGGFADYLTLPVRNLFKISENLSFEEAALIEPTATCVYAIMRVGINFGSSVLVIGNGPIGQPALQAAYTAGAGEVMISGSYDFTLNIAEKYGAKKMINRHKEDVLKAVKDYTDGNGVDIVIECCGKVNGLEQAIAAVKAGGKLYLLSFYSREKIETHINSIIIKDLNIYGCLGSQMLMSPQLIC